MAGSGCSVHSRYESGCTHCRRIDRTYDRRRRRAIAAGTWQFKTPADVVISHINGLTASGMTLNAIARSAKVSPRTLQDLRNRTHVHGVTADAVLQVAACGPTPRLGEVSAVAAGRKVQALTAIGWSLPEQGRRLGMSTQQVWELAWRKQRFVSQVTDRRIDDLFEQLSATLGPSKRARNTARKNGWFPPLVWDDIDAPDAVPSFGESAGDEVDEVAVERALAGQRMDLTDAELVAVLQAGVARGEPLSKLADRLGVNYFGARKMLGGELTPRREKQARIEAEVLRSTADDYVIAANLGVQRSTVSRARARLVASGALGAA